MRKNESFNTKNIARLAVIAAMYVAMTLAVPALSYNAVQLRFSEILVLLCFYRKDYAPAMIAACFISNLFSPFGLYDIIFGTLATAAAVLPMYHVKNIYIAALLPTLSNGIIVGIELALCGEPLFFSMGTVALGELIVMAVGSVIFKFVFEKSPVMMRLIGS